MISALLVKELREKSGAGMMDAKALLETDGDLEAAQIGSEQRGFLRQKRRLLVCRRRFGWGHSA